MARSYLSAARIELVCILIMLKLFVVTTSIMFTIHYFNHVRIAMTPISVVSTSSTLQSANAGEKESDVGHRLSRSHERVAVCFGGSLRSFHHDFVHDVLLNRTLLPLRRQHRTDVFFYVRLDDASPIHTLTPAPGPLSLQAALKFEPVNVTLVTNGTLDAATQRFMASAEWKRGPFWHAVIQNELRSACDRWEVDESTKQDVLKAPANCATTNRIRFPRALLRSKQCLQMIMQHERNSGFTYDWVYKLRPDTILLDRVPLPYGLNRLVAYTNQADPVTSKHAAYFWRRTRNVDKAGNGPVNDEVMFSSRSVATEFLSAFDGIDDCEFYDDQLSMQAPENTLRLWILKKQLAYRAQPFAWATVLERSGPTCGNLIYQHVPGNQDWKLSLQQCLSFAQQLQPVFPDAPNFTQALLDLPALNRTLRHMYAYDL